MEWILHFKLYTYVHVCMQQIALQGYKLGRGKGGRKKEFSRREEEGWQKSPQG